MKIVELEGDGNLLVMGKPFFPIFMFGVGTRPEMLEVKNIGFNTTFMGPTKRGHRHGLMGMGDEGSGMPESRWLLNYLPDEPEGAVGVDGKTPYPPAWIDMAAKRSHRKWPDLPVGVMLYDILGPKRSALSYLKTGVDIILTDPYPVIEGWQPEAVAVQIKTIKRLTKKPIWVCLQAWTARDKKGDWLPMPSPEENEKMVRIALEEGAAGIGWFTYRYRDTWADKDVLLKEAFPELWESIKKMVKEIRRCKSQ